MLRSTVRLYVSSGSQYGKDNGIFVHDACIFFRDNFKNQTFVMLHPLLR